MATITTAGSGNWSSVTPNAPWPGGTVPTAADDVIIANTHTVTLNTTGLVALSLTINSGGTLVAATAATSALTVQNGVANNGTLTLDVSSDVTKTCTFKVNNSRGTNDIVNTAASTTFKGFVKTRWCRLSSALVANTTKSVNVTDATGWQVGDRLVFIATDPITAYGQAPHTDKVTIATITPVGGTIATVTWTDGTGTGGAVKYAHATNSHVGNFSSNLIIGPANSGDGTCIYDTGNSVKRQYTDVQFESLGQGNGFLHIGVSGNVQSAAGDKVSNCAFYNFSGVGIGFSYGNTAFARDRNIYYTLDTNANAAISGQASPTDVGPDTDMVIFNVANGNGYGVYLNRPGMVLTRPTISGCLTGVTSIVVDATVVNGSMFSNTYPVGVQSSQITLTGTNIGKEFAGAKNWQVAYEGDFGQRTLIDCPLDTTQTIIGASYNASPSNDFIKIVDKDTSVIVQEIYRPFGTIKRDNANNKRSTSSVAIKPTTLAIDTQYTVSIPCANGATIRVVGYCKMTTTFYNGGGAGFTAPTAILSGLGMAAVTYTASAAANNAFELIDISITNTSGADGNFTLTLTANAKSVTTGTVYFDGIPTNSPFVTKARHYGFTFDQTLPTAVASTSQSANEATALTYSGQFTVTGGASQSNVALAANTTFQKLYDYTQAWSCTTANLGQAVPLSAPVQGVLLAAGNLTTTGFALTGSGSIAMSGFTLASEFTVGGFTYTYSGGTYSQASAGSPSFVGGTLSMPAQGAVTNTYTFSDNSGTINFAPSADGSNYNLGAGTFTGTITLTNTAGHTCTVQLPAGTAVINATSGINLITVVTPSLYQSVTINGYTTGSRIQIYDVTSSTELYNNIPGAAPFTWTDSVPASASRLIRARISYCTAATANVFVDQNIGTCGTTAGNKDISFTANPAVDSVYVNNLIDGTVITDCSISGSALLVVINAGSTTWQHIYAFMTYWLFTVGGIRDQFLEMTAIDQTHYIFATAHGSFKIKNGTSGPVVPLLVTGGNAQPASGAITDILDTSGGSIFCIEGTVVAFTTSSQAVNLATVQAGLTAQGYTSTRAPKIDNMDAAVSGVPVAVLDLPNGVETGLTLRGALRVVCAVLFGKLSGAAGTPIVIRDVNDTKNRVTAAVDASGNRTSVTIDPS